jgi:hypothetical protein
MSLLLDLFDSPELIAVYDEVSELVGRVEPRTSPIVLIATQDDNWPIRKGEGERVDIGAVEGQPNDDRTVPFEELYHVGYRARGELPRCPNLSGRLL